MSLPAWRCAPCSPAARPTARLHLIFQGARWQTPTSRAPLRQSLAAPGWRGALVAIILLVNGKRRRSRITRHLKQSVRSIVMTVCNPDLGLPDRAGIDLPHPPLLKLA